MVPQLTLFVEITLLSRRLKSWLVLDYGESITEWSAYLERTNILEESVHVDRRVRSEVHKETQQ